MQSDALGLAEVTVRAAVHADVPAILDIYNDAVLKTTASYDYEPRSLAHRLSWFEDHERNGLPVFVVEEKRRVLGWSALNRFHDRMGYRFTLENSIYIAEPFRGRGLGKQLMPPLIASARARSFHVIVAVIDASNEASVRLHARFGFQVAGNLREVGFKFGRWLNVVYMQLVL
jgi:L-amino acid N-acyltransferase